MTKQDVEFIANTISDMLEGVDANSIPTILGLANKYTEVRNFPKDKSNWTDKQLSLYFTYIEKVLDMPVMYTQSEFNDLDIIHKVQAVMGDVKDNTPMQAGAKTKGIVDKMEQQNKYRDDLKCPCPNKLMVWDNRKTKRTDKSPDFTCSGKTPEECPQHTGKWRKSWWLDNSDVPKEWGMTG